MLAEYLRKNGIRVLDRYSRTRWFRFLSPINWTLTSALEAAAERYAQGELLDAGAGRRPYAAMLRRHAKAYVSVDRSDPGDGGIDVPADLETLELGRSFDTIICTQVLEHSGNPEALVRRLGEHLAPGGFLILTAPHLSMLHNEPDDYFRFTEYGLRELFRRAGLEPVEMRKVGGMVVFLGHLAATLWLNLAYGVPGLRRAAVYAGIPFVCGCVLLDGWFGFRRFLPVNHLAVATRRAG